MIEPESVPTLQDLVSAYERAGVKALGELASHAALLHCENKVQTPSWGFETRAVTAPWDIRVGIALSRSGRLADPELVARAGAVYAVTKRRGGPFPDRIGVGRARSADISLRVGTVSKYHAYFTCDPATQAWTLYDARSTNGTTVGEYRLPPGDGVKVENGANILFGGENFLFFTRAGFQILVQSLAQGMPGR